MSAIILPTGYSNLFDPKNHIGRDETDKALTGAGESLAKNILAMLRKKYPAVADGWRVWVNENGGLVMVKNVLLAGDMGFIQHINKIDTDYKAVMRSGGELLERYRIARAGAETLIKDQINSQARNIKGNLRADV